MNDRHRNAADPDLETIKQAATLQLLLKAARLTNERAIARMRARLRAQGKPGAALRTAHTALLPQLDFAGIRLTTLAGRLGVTKQAVAQLVDDLVHWGVVERVPDPTDGRAKLIRYAPAGGAALRDGLSLLRTLESECAERMEAGTMDALRTGLLALLAVLEHSGPAET